MVSVQYTHLDTLPVVYLNDSKDSPTTNLLFQMLEPFLKMQKDVLLIYSNARLSLLLAKIQTVGLDLMKLSDPALGRRKDLVSVTQEVVVVVVWCG